MLQVMNMNDNTIAQLELQDGNIESKQMEEGKIMWGRIKKGAPLSTPSLCYR